MNRRLVLSATAVALAGLATVPAGAAPAKAKPFKGSYSVTLNPDPSMYHGQGPDAFGTGCKNVVKESIDRRKMTIPGAGTLKVVLDSPDPTQVVLSKSPIGLGYDWDLHILVDDGAKAPTTGAPAEEVLTSSNGPTAHEETTTKFTKKRNIIIEVCNNVGTPSQRGTITYSFKP